MAESSLNIAYLDLQKDIAFFLGWNTDPALRTAREQTAIDSFTKSGLRQFYFPPPIDGGSATYEWSFLRPVATLTLAQGAQSTALPDDFACLDGNVTLSVANEVTFPLKVFGEGMLRAAYARNSSLTGRPEMVAVAPLKTNTVNTSQRFSLLSYPIADQDYTLTLAYTILPEYLSGIKPYAYGGAAHAETILASCLAIAEQRNDDAMTVNTIKFKERLAASIGFDRRLKPQQYGYNGDRSDYRGRSNGRWWNGAYDSLIVTYNGVTG